jgi:hypothetical protein
MTPKLHMKRTATWNHLYAADIIFQSGYSVLQAAVFAEELFVCAGCDFSGIIT